MNELQGEASSIDSGVTEDLLRQWYEADAAGAASSMISIPQTWRRYQGWAHKRGVEADIQGLRRVLELLYNEGRIWLEPYDRPYDLAESEQALMIPMSLGPPGYSWCWSD